MNTNLHQSNTLVSYEQTLFLPIINTSINQLSARTYYWSATHGLKTAASVFTKVEQQFSLSFEFRPRCGTDAPRAEQTIFAKLKTPRVVHKTMTIHWNPKGDVLKFDRQIRNRKRSTRKALQFESSDGRAVSFAALAPQGGSGFPALFPVRSKSFHSFPRWWPARSWCASAARSSPTSSRCRALLPWSSAATRSAPRRRRSTSSTISRSWRL